MRPRRLKDLTSSERVILGRLMWAFIIAGWNPPTPSDAVYDRILSDIGRDRDESSYAGRRQETGRDKKLHAGASLSLSRREIQFLALYAEGLTKPEIGERLGVSSETVKSQLAKAQARLGARNLTHAVAIAIRDSTI